MSFVLEHGLARALQRAAALLEVARVTRAPADERWPTTTAEATSTISAPAASVIVNGSERSRPFRACRQKNSRLVQEVADERQRLCDGDRLVLAGGRRSTWLNQDGGGAVPIRRKIAVRQPLEHHQIERARGWLRKACWSRACPLRRQAMAISRASVVNASSTPSPVLALVLTTRQPWSTSFTRVSFVDLPLAIEIRLVQQQQERHPADHRLGLLLQGHRGVERRVPGAVGDQQVARTRRAGRNRGRSGIRPARRCPTA